LTLASTIALTIALTLANRKSILLFKDFSDLQVETRLVGKRIGQTVFRSRSTFFGYIDQLYPAEVA
jgi:hypothetical protein